MCALHREATSRTCLDLMECPFAVGVMGVLSLHAGNLDAATQQQLAQAQAHRRGRKSASPGPAGMPSASNGSFLGPPGGSALRNAFAAAASYSSNNQGLHLPPGGLHGALTRQHEARLQQQQPQQPGIAAPGFTGPSAFHKGLLNGTGLLNGGHRSNSTGNHQLW